MRRHCIGVRKSRLSLDNEAQQPRTDGLGRSGEGLFCDALEHRRIPPAVTLPEEKGQCHAVGAAPGYRAGEPEPCDEDAFSSLITSDCKFTSRLGELVQGDERSHLLLVTVRLLLLHPCHNLFWCLKMRVREPFYSGSIKCLFWCRQEKSLRLMLGRQQQQFINVKILHTVLIVMQALRNVPTSSWHQRHTLACEVFCQGLLRIENLLNRSVNESTRRRQTLMNKFPT